MPSKNCKLILARHQTRTWAILDLWRTIVIVNVLPLWYTFYRRSSSTSTIYHMSTSAIIYGLWPKYMQLRRFFNHAALEESGKTDCISWIFVFCLNSNVFVGLLFEWLLDRLDARKCVRSLSFEQLCRRHWSTFQTDVWSSSFDFPFCQSVGQSFARSLARSTAPSIARSLDRSLGRSLGRSVGRSVARSVARSLARSR